MAITYSMSRAGNETRWQRQEGLRADRRHRLDCDSAKHAGEVSSHPGKMENRPFVKGRGGLRFRHALFPSFRVCLFCESKVANSHILDNSFVNVRGRVSNLSFLSRARCSPPAQRLIADTLDGSGPRRRRYLPALQPTHISPQESRKEALRENARLSHNHGVSRFWWTLFVPL